MNMANYVVMHVNKNEKSYLFMVPHGVTHDDVHEVLLEFSSHVMEMKKAAAKEENKTDIVDLT